MPAGGETIICGQYTVTYNAVATGIFQGDNDVPALEQVTKVADSVDSTDRYAKSTIDHSYGGADWFLAMVAKEYKAGSLTPFWPFGTLGLMGVIARLYYAMASATVLTAIAGTPAAAAPATLTASKSILAPGFNGRLLFGPQIRNVPLRLQLLPFDTGGGAIGWFTTTILLIGMGLASLGAWIV